MTKWTKYGFLTTNNTVCYIPNIQTLYIVLHYAYVKSMAMFWIVVTVFDNVLTLPYCISGTFVIWKRQLSIFTACEMLFSYSIRIKLTFSRTHAVSRLLQKWPDIRFI